MMSATYVILQVMGTGYRINKSSGFVTYGTNSQDDPMNWVVWHMTHIDNIEGISKRGALAPKSSAGAIRSIANSEVQERRASKRPLGLDQTIHDYVPWYFASKSPMLYAKHDIVRDLVFFGATIAQLASTNLQIVASDGNAAAYFTEFTQDLESLGTFIDYDLLQEQFWNNTELDTDRKRRRAAELLVTPEVDLSLISFVAGKTESTTQRAKEMLELNCPTKIQQCSITTRTNLFY